MKLRCPHDDCNNEWDYTGNKKWATCTSCRRKINVEKNQVVIAVAMTT